MSGLSYMISIDCDCGFDKVLMLIVFFPPGVPSSDVVLLFEVVVLLSNYITCYELVSDVNLVVASRFLRPAARRSCMSVTFCWWPYGFSY